VKRIYQLNKGGSFKENIRDVLPVIFDDFFALKEIVKSYPLRKNMLHEMRKRGKPLRYAMELGEYSFGEEFAGQLDEVKKVVELLGEIHDADVIIPDVNRNMKEIRLFNSTFTQTGQKLSTKTLRDYTAAMRRQRKEMYDELCNKLNLWEKNNFRVKLIKAIQDLKSP
jgi:CHAD domain-containing protein